MNYFEMTKRIKELEAQGVKYTIKPTAPKQWDVVIVEPKLTAFKPKETTDGK